MKNIVIVFVIYLFFTSCKEDVNPTPYLYSTLLTGKIRKSWKATSFQALKEGGSEFNYSLDDCERDDRYIFYAGTERRFELVNGNSPCDSEANGAVLIDDTWEIENSAATLLTFFPPLAGDFKLPFIIQKLEKNKMTLDIFADQENTIRYRVFFELVSEE